MRQSSCKKCGLITPEADGHDSLCSDCAHKAVAEQRAEIERLRNKLDNERGHRQADNNESKAEIERLRRELDDLKQRHKKIGMLIEGRWDALRAEIAAEAAGGKHD